MTTTYYIPTDRIQGDLAELPEDEARHAVQVLRQQEGDEIVAVDGHGGWYRIHLTAVGKKRATGRVVERRREVGEPAYRLTVGLAILKNQNRFDVFAEKASELGVSRIMPLITQRTEKHSLREQRVDNLLIAAMKQCGRSRLIQVAPVTPLGEVLHRSSAQIKLIAHEQVDTERSFLKALEAAEKSPEIIVLIGPEGGFAEEEVADAVSAGFEAVSLGSRRLRAETAAIAASAGAMLVLRNIR